MKPASPTPPDFGRFVKDLAAIQLPDVFNPYRDHDPKHDLPNAPAIRRQNLLAYLVTLWHHHPRELWIAESGSHTGTRRSGLPLIPTTEIEALNERFGDTRFRSATLTDDVAGMTATYVWEVARAQNQLPLFWNAVMAQPHRPGQPYRNRTARRATLRAYQPALRQLVNWFAPEKVIAIGRLAGRSLSELDIPFTYVRHPAQGGATAFRQALLPRPRLNDSRKKP